MNSLLTRSLWLCSLTLVPLADAQSAAQPGFSASAIDWTAGDSPGVARADLKENLGVLENDLLRAAWEVKTGHLILAGITDKGTGRTQSFDSLEDDFSIGLKDGETIGSRRFSVVGKWQQRRLAGSPQGVRLADRIPGEAIEAMLRDDTSGTEILWRAELRTARTTCDRLISSRARAVVHRLKSRMFPH